MPPQDYGSLAILVEQLLLSVAKPNSCLEKFAFQIIRFGLVESDAVLFKSAIRQSSDSLIADEQSRATQRTRLQQVAKNDLQKMVHKPTGPTDQAEWPPKHAAR